MIYTLTCNPSLDYRMDICDLQWMATNRSVREDVCAGGKGINVSRMLAILGIKSKALGFAAGFTGEEILRQLHEWGLYEEFIRLPGGLSRINVKLKNHYGSFDPEETEINAAGPAIDEKSAGMLMQRIDAVEPGDILILSGSTPAGLTDTFYRDIMHRIGQKTVQVIVDAAGDLLVNTLSCRPFLIKPNQHELETLFGVSLLGYREAVPYAKKLQQSGARNVLVSFGGKGAMLLTEDGTIFEADAPGGELKNAVGSGDCMVAGFLAGFIKWQDYQKAFSLGISAGSANAFSDTFPSEKDVFQVYDSLCGCHSRTVRP